MKQFLEHQFVPKLTKRLDNKRFGSTGENMRPSEHRSLSPGIKTSDDGGRSSNEGIFPSGIKKGGYKQSHNKTRVIHVEGRGNHLQDNLNSVNTSASLGLRQSRDNASREGSRITIYQQNQRVASIGTASKVNKANMFNN